MRGLADVLVGGPAIGAWLKLSAEESAEIMLRAGFDFVVVDGEHSTLGLDQVMRLLRLAVLADVPALVRLPVADRVTYQKVLDAGACSVLAPMIETVEQMRTGLSYTSYPPAGLRGFSLGTTAADWGRTSRSTHLAESDQAITYVPQLESPKALAALAEIARAGTGGAAFIGRADLSVTMSRDVRDPAVERLVLDAVATAHDAGLRVGTACSTTAEDIRWCLDSGFDFVVVTDDATSLSAGVASALATARQASDSVAESVSERPEEALVPPAMLRDVMDLIGEFAHRVDRDSGRGVEDLFLSGGYYESDGRRNTGRDAIRASYDRRRERGPRTSRHVFTDVAVRTEGPSRLRVRSVMTLYAGDGVGTPPPVVSLVADVEDNIIAREGRLYFAGRRLTTVFVNSENPPVLSFGVGDR